MLDPELKQEILKESKLSYFLRLLAINLYTFDKDENFDRVLIQQEGGHVFSGAALLVEPRSSIHSSEHMETFSNTNPPMRHV